MKIQCLCIRDGGSKVELDGLEYHFEPLADGSHVAEVADSNHVDRFLAIPEGYKLYHGEHAPKGSAKRVAEPAEQRKVAPETRRTGPLAGSDVHPPRFEINGLTYELGEIVAKAFEASGLSEDEWNELEDEDRLARIDIVLDDLAEAKPKSDEADREELAAQYEAKFGKKPHHKMSVESIKAKLAE